MGKSWLEVRLKGKPSSLFNGLLSQACSERDSTSEILMSHFWPFPVHLSTTAIQAWCRWSGSCKLLHLILWATCPMFFLPQPPCLPASKNWSPKWCSFLCTSVLLHLSLQIGLLSPVFANMHIKFNLQKLLLNILSSSRHYSVSPLWKEWLNVHQNPYFPFH